MPNECFPEFCDISLVILFVLPLFVQWIRYRYNIETNIEMMGGLEDWLLVEKAAVFLEDNNVKDYIPAFSATHNVVKGRRRRIQLLVEASGLVQDRVEEPGTKPETLGALGQLASRCSWLMQEEWRVGEGSLMQNNFQYTHMRDPLPEELLHIIGKSTASPLGTHFLSFSIHSYADRRRVPIGSGTSSLVMRPLGPHSPSGLLDTGDGSSDSSWASSDDGSYTSSSNSGASTPTLAPSSPPPPTMPANKRSNFLSKIDNNNKKKRYMLVNVRTCRPSENVELIRMMTNLQIDPTEISHEVMPIKSRNQFVYFFSVTEATQKARIEMFSGKSTWREMFNVTSMCTENATPFFSKELSMRDVIEAMFLAEGGAHENRVGSCFDNDLSDLIADKTEIGQVLKDVQLVKSIIDHLSKKGLHIFNSAIRKSAIQ